MKTDDLKKLVEAATREPWSVPHFADDDTRCNCKYVLAEYGGMGSIATIGVCKNMDGPWGDDNGPDVEQAKANARLIAAAPALAREVIALREAAGEVLRCEDAVDAEAARAEKDGGWSSAPVVARSYALATLRAALAEDDTPGEKEGE